MSKAEERRSEYDFELLGLWEENEEKNEVEGWRMSTEEPIFGDTERADIDCDWRRRAVGKSDKRNGWAWRGERMWDVSVRVVS